MNQVANQVLSSIMMESSEEDPKFSLMDGSQIVDAVHFQHEMGHLSCTGLDLQTIPEELGAHYGAQVTRLDLSCNLLRYIDNLGSFVCLEELLLDNNDLGDEFVLPRLPQLQTLSLNKNRILDLDRLLQMLSESCVALKYLSLIGNGACPNGLIWGTSDDDYTKYRRTVIVNMPGLMFLDSTAISATERAYAVDTSYNGGYLASRIAMLKSKIIGSLGERDEPLPESVDHSVVTLDFYDESVNKSSFLGLHMNKCGVLGISLLAEKWIVTCGSDGVLKVFDLTEGAWQYKCVAILKGHKTRVRAVACFPDVRVVSCSDDRTIRVWDLAAQSCLRTLRGHTGVVNNVITTSDGRIVSCSEDMSVRIWELSKKAPIVLNGHRGAVLCIAETPNLTILSGSADSTIKLWNPKTRACLLTLDGHNGSVLTVTCISGTYIASGSVDCTVKVWHIAEEVYFLPRQDDTDNLSQVSLVSTLKGHRSSITSVMAYDNEHIVTSSADKLIAVWDIKTMHCITVLSGHDDAVMAVIKLGDGTLASCSNNIKLWDLDKPDQKGSRAALTQKFNSHCQGDRKEFKLWRSMKAFLKHDRADNDEPAYADLTTQYPSTIGMFASNYQENLTLEQKERQFHRLVNVLFSQVGDVQPLTELKAKVHDWTVRLRRRKGPKMVDWLGILKGKRIRQALLRLSSLCDEAGQKRVTYLKVKEKLIEEFGEDLFVAMKEQVTMELAMRDFMLAGGGAAGASPKHAPQKNKGRFFPETFSPVKPDHNVVEGIEPDDDYEDLQISVDTDLLSFFNTITDDDMVQTEQDRTLAKNFETVTAEFETGKNLPQSPIMISDDMWVKAVEMSTLWRDESFAMDDDDGKDDGLFQMEDVEENPFKDETPTPQIALRDEVWA
eukprot:m.123700 g.123700  ORF g.123700 m.123700 type:complete len:892 (+) comp29007_c0_seq1:457-3132(+)